MTQFNKFLIKHPIISEKASRLAALNKYIFAVDGEATAPEIKKAVEGIHKVQVAKVNMINGKDKPSHFGRTIGKKPGERKAIVTLKEGQKLDLIPH